MTNIETRIQGSEKLINIFGYWPSFHDAEVIELNFWRGNVDPDVGSYDFPVLTVKLHLWEITDDLNGQGYFGRVKHTLTTMRSMTWTSSRWKDSTIRTRSWDSILLKNSVHKGPHRSSV